MDAEEVLRWMFRHQVCLDFDRDEDGKDYAVMIVPLRVPENSADKIRASVRHMSHVVPTVRAMAITVRDRVMLE